MKTLQQLHDELVSLRRQRHELQRRVDSMTIDIETLERAWGEAACAFAQSEYEQGRKEGWDEGYEEGYQEASVKGTSDDHT